MKKMILFLTFIFSFAFAQDTVYFKVEPTKGHLVSNVRFDQNYAYLMNLDGTVESRVEKESILRIGYFDVNSKVGDGQFEPPTVTDTLTNKDRKLLYEAGIHLKRARDFTFGALGLTIAGGIITGVGFGANINSMGYVGLAVTATGAILSLIPPIQLGKSGNFLIKFGSQ